MLGQDAFAWFESHGGLTRANGQRFRDMVLSRGDTLDYGEMYRGFTGHDPDINPYLEYYGLPRLVRLRLPRLQRRWLRPHRKRASEDSRS